MSSQHYNEKPLEAYREEFPVTKKYLYLDHAGVAPVSLRVKKAIEEFVTEATEAGVFNYEKWMQRIEKARQSAARLIGSDSDEIAFVKNTSHGLSIVAEGLDWKEGDNLLVYEKEFPSNIYPWLNLKRKGVEVRFIPSRDGRIVVDDIERLIDSKTRLLSISSVQFLNGFRIDFKRVGQVCREKGILLCVDAIQSLGVFPMDVKKYPIDFLSADGHKWLLAPEGTGIFSCRKERAEKINPPLIGWKSVESEFDFDHIDFHLKTNAWRFEEGSMNLMGIFALGAAIDLLLEVGIERIERRILKLGDGIIREAEKRGFALKSPDKQEERGGIVSFKGNFDPDDVKDRLRARDILVNVRGGAMRVSPHFYNTEDEVIILFQAIDEVSASL